MGLPLPIGLKQSFSTFLRDKYFLLFFFLVFLRLIKSEIIKAYTDYG